VRIDAGHITAFQCYFDDSPYVRWVDAFTGEEL